MRSTFYLLHLVVRKVCLFLANPLICQFAGVTWHPPEYQVVCSHVVKTNCHHTHPPPVNLPRSKHDTLNQCRFNVTLNRHWFNVSCLMGEKQVIITSKNALSTMYIFNITCTLNYTGKCFKLGVHYAMSVPTENRGSERVVLL